MRDALAGGVGHDRAIGHAVATDEAVAVGIIVSALRAGVLTIMRAAEVVAEFVSEGVGAGRVHAADHAESVAGEVGVDAGHQVAEAGVGVHGLGEEADEVGAVLIAPVVDGIHVAIGGILQASQVGGGGAGLGVGHLTAEDEIEGDGHQRVGQGLVGLSHCEVNGGIHRGDAARARARRSGVHDHDVDDGVGRRVAFQRWQ